MKKYSSKIPPGYQKSGEIRYELGNILSFEPMQSYEPAMNSDLIYKKLGEFVVSFQWLENRFREIGWLILDPKRTQQPPKSLRKESFGELIDKVHILYTRLIDNIAPKDAEERKQAFEAITRESHALRKYRNSLIHSAYIELKAGGEVFGILRSNPRLKEYPISNDLLREQEMLTEQSFEFGMKRMADVAMQLNLHYIQLIHWAPFDEVRGHKNRPKLNDS